MITNTVELRNAIEKLESDKVIQLQLLKQEFHTAYTSINPLNFLSKNSAASPLLGNKMISTSVGLATGYLIKKWIVGRSSNPVRTFIGSAVQIGAINLMAKYQGTIELFGRSLLQLVLNKAKKQNDTL